MGAAKTERWSWSRWFALLGATAALGLTLAGCSGGGGSSQPPADLAGEDARYLPDAADAPDAAAPPDSAATDLHDVTDAGSQDLGDKGPGDPGSDPGDGGAGDADAQQAYGPVEFPAQPGVVEPAGGKVTLPDDVAMPFSDLLVLTPGGVAPVQEDGTFAAWKAADGPSFAWVMTAEPAVVLAGRLDSPDPQITLESTAETLLFLASAVWMPDLSDDTRTAVLDMIADAAETAELADILHQHLAKNPLALAQLDPELAFAIQSLLVDLGGLDSAELPLTAAEGPNMQSGVNVIVEGEFTYKVQNVWLRPGTVFVERLGTIAKDGTENLKKPGDPVDGYPPMSLPAPSGVDGVISAIAALGTLLGGGGGPYDPAELPQKIILKPDTDAKLTLYRLVVIGPGAKTPLASLTLPPSMTFQAFKQLIATAYENDQVKLTGEQISNFIGWEAYALFKVLAGVVSLAVEAEGFGSNPACDPEKTFLKNVDDMLSQADFLFSLLYATMTEGPAKGAEQALPILLKYLTTGGAGGFGFSDLDEWLVCVFGKFTDPAQVTEKFTTVAKSAMAILKMVDLVLKVGNTAVSLNDLTSAHPVEEWTLKLGPAAVSLEPALSSLKAGTSGEVPLTVKAKLDAVPENVLVLYKWDCTCAFGSLKHPVDPAAQPPFETYLPNATWQLDPTILNKGEDTVAVKVVVKNKETSEEVIVGSATATIVVYKDSRILIPVPASFTSADTPVWAMVVLTDEHDAIEFGPQKDTGEAGDLTFSLPNPPAGVWLSAGPPGSEVTGPQVSQPGPEAFVNVHTDAPPLQGPLPFNVSGAAAKPADVILNDLSFLCAPNAEYFAWEGNWGSGCVTQLSLEYPYGAKTPAQAAPGTKILAKVQVVKGTQCGVAMIWADPAVLAVRHVGSLDAPADLVATAAPDVPAGLADDPNFPVYNFCAGGNAFAQPMSGKMGVGVPLPTSDVYFVEFILPDQIDKASCLTVTATPKNGTPFCAAGYLDGPKVVVSGGYYSAAAEDYKPWGAIRLFQLQYYTCQ